MERLIIWLAAGLGLGFIPGAPGTYGALLGIPLAWLFSRLGLGLGIASLVAFLAFSAWVAGNAENLLKKPDPPSVVIDEISGMTLALVFIPWNWTNVILGFCLFRFFDVVKIGPVKWANEKLHGGIGILSDDLLAGLIANCLLRLVVWIW